jgi:hypothetical protein
MVKFQMSQDFDDLFSLAHAEPFVTSFFRSVPVRGSVVNLLIYLANQLTRGFQSLKLKRLKVFSLWYPTSRARSQSSTNLAYCTDLSPSLAFSGLARFGTWRIFVPSSINCFTNLWFKLMVFWATCRHFSIIPIIFGF